MSRHLAVMTANDNLVATADHYSRESDPHADAEAEHAAELLALAARELVRAVHALPEDEQPIGWRTDQSSVNPEPSREDLQAEVEQLRAKLAKAEKASRELAALEAYGVDNWVAAAATARTDRAMPIEVFTQHPYDAVSRPEPPSLVDEPSRE